MSKLHLFREASQFSLAKIDSICIARNEVKIASVFCEVGDDLRIITAERKVVAMKRVFDSVKTRQREEAVFGLRFNPISPIYYVYFTNTHIMLDSDTLCPLHYFATDIKTHRVYMMFQGYIPERHEKPSWL